MMAGELICLQIIMSAAVLVYTFAIAMDYVVNTFFCGIKICLHLYHGNRLKRMLVFNHSAAVVAVYGRNDDITASGTWHSS